MVQAFRNSNNQEPFSWRVKTKFFRCLFDGEKKITVIYMLLSFWNRQFRENIWAINWVLNAGFDVFSSFPYWTRVFTLNTKGYYHWISTTYLIFAHMGSWRRLLVIDDDDNNTITMAVMDTFIIAFIPVRSATHPIAFHLSPYC